MQPAIRAAPPGLLHVTSPVSTGALIVHVRAPVDRSLLIDHCNGDPGWRLYRQDGAQWDDVWSGEMNACASSPIRIAAGTSRAFDLTGYNGTRVPLQSGRYRLVLHALRWDAGPHAPVADTQVSPVLRESNPFDWAAPAR